MANTSTEKPDWASVASIVVATLAVYANTFSVPFVFDDIAAIAQNPSIEHISTALHPPNGLSVTGRPLVNLSFALNFALSGREVWSYHALNLALHVTNGLLLFGVVRRVLAARATWPPLRPQCPNLDANSIALTTALLWSLHPLQTAAVTYVMQRSELLVSCCYLLVLYAFVHGIECHLLNDTAPNDLTRAAGKCHLIDDTAPRRISRGWLAWSAVACALGMTAKEVMVTAPLAVLLCDRTFFAGSFHGALRARPRYYAGLAASWIVLAALLLGTDSRGESAGFGSAVPWYDYAVTQLHAVVLYLRLIAWPAPLIFDYGATLIPATGAVLLGAAVILALTIAIVAAWRRHAPLGFCGATFFLLLAPTTTIVPIATQTIAEHRLYLALAFPAALAAIGLSRLPGRARVMVTVALALALGTATVARNHDYRSVSILWADTVRKRPTNARAHYNLAVALLGTGTAADVTRAYGELTLAVRLDPRHAPANQQLGVALVRLNRPAEALPPLEQAVRLQPESASAHHDLALALVRLGRTRDAAAEFGRAIQLDPSQAAAHYNFARALADLGRYPEALAEFETAARLDPADASARDNAARLRDYLRK